MSVKERRKRLAVRDLVTIALAAAFIVIMAHIAIPFPGGVPLTLQTFAIPLIAIVLGARKGVLAVILYLFLGAIGLPVFANFNGGIGAFLGPTGGFLWSFPIMALLVGFGAKLSDPSRVKPCLWSSLIVANLINFLCGMVHFQFVMGVTTTAAFLAAVAPFIPGALVKILAAGLIGSEIRKRLSALQLASSKD
jgi:biotin transport system substrate-specific component